MSYSPFFDPILAGDPRAVTATAGDNDTSIATTAFVQGELADYLPLAGGTMTGDITLGSGVDINFNDTNSGLQWSDVRVDRAAADVISLGAGDQIRVQQDPVDDNDLVRKSYVDAVATGLDVKESVRAASTADIDLATGGLLTIDGVSLSSGDRVLVKDQTAGAENGIYTAAAGAWTRATDADEDAEVTAGLFTFVEEGNTYADQGWILTTNDPITVDTTALTFSQFSSTQTVSNLDDLNDVDTTGVVDGSLLRYEATGTVWNDTPTLLFDDNGQLQIFTDGSTGGLVMGSAGDVNLYRQAANTLRTDDDLDIGANITLAPTGGISLFASNSFLGIQELDPARNAILIKQSGDTQNRIQLDSDGNLEFGSGSATPDTNIYRSAANTLATDDSLNVGINLSVTGTATFQSGVTFAVESKTADYAVDLDDDHIILVDNSADTTDITITLPASHVSGDIVHIKDSGGNAASGTNQILIATADADTIDGSAADFELTVDYQAITVVSDGTNWFII